MTMEDLRTERKGHILAVKSLPTLPDALDEVTRLVEDPSSSTEQIAKAISRDQVLSAKVLKMVNSPIYGFPGRIGSIQHALVLLGFNVIRGIIISTSVFDIMTTSMAGLWEHSQGCAMAAANVARAAGFKDPEEYAVAGLLHDIGKVLAAVQLPDLKAEADELVENEDIRYLEAEQRVFGFGHDRINMWLADYWNLPLRLKEALILHHRPHSPHAHYPDMPRVVHVADFLTRLFEVGHGGDDQVSPLDREAFEALGFNLRSMNSLMDSVAADFEELSTFSAQE
jgi:HD-like signal output (HDOD) protein